MKLAALTLLGSLVFSSASFAFFETDVNCKTSDGKLQLNITTINRPDFELSEYDSATGDNDGVEMTLKKDGQSVNASLKVRSASSPSSSPRYENREDGKVCLVGSKTTGIVLKTRLQIAGQASANVRFTCTEIASYPRAAIDCE
jgi:hypothetical protein